MQAENIAVSEEESRYRWIERWLSTHYFYGNYDPGLVLAYHEHNKEPYSVVYPHRYSCPQLLADLEMLHQQNRLTKDHVPMSHEGQDLSFSIYMLHDDRYQLYW